MPNIIITKGTYDKFLTLRPIFKHLLDAFIAENSIEIVYSITNTITYNQLASIIHNHLLKISESLIWRRA